ncbi:MAG: HlyD family efflux transporter periplasmic adaptor subunit [Alphaproteobacteria bacterium]|nr:HlyD family efflux transporter periplasmic adaptor subunit [Alphaproteobacteria bacterium]
MDWLRAALAGLIGLFAPAPAPDGVFYGYVEGEYAHLGPRDGGILRSLAVARGDTVRSGTVVATLDAVAEAAAVDEARARLAQAEAQLDNLRKGRRTPEIDALVAQKDQAEAALHLSQAQYRRQTQLPAGQVVSVDRVDQARAAFERDRGRVAELTAQIAVARLAARDDEIEAAEAAVAMAAAAVRQADWRLAQRSLAAPADGLVADTLFVPGEFVAAGTPIVSLLPPGNIRLRIFVPEAWLSRVAVGRTISVGCDGCAQGMTARISYLSPRAEFTPPVIYSRETRAKLVFMAEAKPVAPTVLNPGQPVEARLLP